MQRKVLGRGLEALIPVGPATATLEQRESGLRDLPIDEIGPNPYQPRTRFDDHPIRALAASIKATGTPQPGLVPKPAARA